MNGRNATSTPSYDNMYPRQIFYLPSSSTAACHPHGLLHAAYCIDRCSLLHCLSFCLFRFNITEWKIISSSIHLPFVYPIVYQCVNLMIMEDGRYFAKNKNIHNSTLLRFLKTYINMLFHNVNLTDIMISYFY